MGRRKVRPDKFCIECGDLIGPHSKKDVCQGCNRDKQAAYLPSLQEIRKEAALIRIENAERDAVTLSPPPVHRFSTTSNKINWEAED